MDVQGIGNRIRRLIAERTRARQEGGGQDVDFENLNELIRIFENSGLSEIEIEENGRRMRLQKPFAASAGVPLAIPAPQIAPPGHGAVGAAPSAPEAEAVDPGVKTIESPMVGTFYAAPAPGESPFVKVGDRVDENNTVCIVEAMKLMNEVVSKFAGVIEKILVENGQPVEFGQALFLVRIA